MIAILTGFLLGLGGSLHCVGMCGPIAIALPNSGLPDSGKRSPWRNIAQDKMAYQFGRVITYTLLGALIGVAGSYISLAGYSKVLSIVCAVVMIAFVSAQVLWKRELISGRAIERTIGVIKRALASLLGKHGTLTHFGIGLLNGLLPCGLVTAALIGALGMAGVLSGSMFMFAFGLGTVPLMSMVALGGSQVSCRIKNRLRYAGPLIGLTVALLLLIRGMAMEQRTSLPSGHAVECVSDCCP